MVVWGGEVPIAAKSGVIGIAAGSAHILALKADGTVVAWGAGATNTGIYPDFGQSIVPVSKSSGVVAISAGGQHSVALLGMPVVLHARPAGNDVILSWPVGSVGYKLQSLFTLTPPIVWIDSMNVPAVVGPQFMITNATSNSINLFRLSRQ